MIKTILTKIVYFFQILIYMMMFSVLIICLYLPIILVEKITGDIEMTDKRYKCWKCGKLTRKSKCECK